jgi:hypothetical protein
MSLEDQAKFAPQSLSSEFYERHPEYAPVTPPPKTDKLERDEQRQFVNWCLLHRLPFVWHGTHKRSSANLGVPDFVVGVNGKVLFIEFKRDHGYQLSAEQQAWCELCLAQGLPYRVVYSSGEAIKLVEEADSL